MQLRSLSLAAMTLAAVALRLPAQTPDPKLDCNRVVMVQSGLTSTCQMRESTSDDIGTLIIPSFPNGGVSIYIWDGGQTLVRSRILAAARSDYQAFALASDVQVQVSPGQVRVSGPSLNMSQNWAVDLEIYVPAATALKLSTLNGGISVQNVTGAIVVSTVNGGITITGATGDVTASSVNGKVSVSAAAPWKGQTILAQAVNGAVEIAVPSDCSAHVELSTVNGSLSTTIPDVNWTFVGHRGAVSFDLRSGESRISGSTVNGSVTVKPTD